MERWLTHLQKRAVTNRVDPDEGFKSYFIFELLPFVNLYTERFNKDISKHFIASSFKLCQPITG